MSRERDFEAGYMCAVATLVKAHRETTMARDLIDAFGRPDWRNVSSYDRMILQDAGLIETASREGGSHD